MDGQKVRMVMGLCLLRIITMVTRASQDTFNGEPSASWCGAAGVPWQGHDLRLETKPKMISQFWNKGLPPKLQSQMLPLRILQGSINQRSRTAHQGWEQQPEILLQVVNTNCNRKLCSVNYFLSVSKELYFLPVIESWILTKYSVLIASVASRYNAQSEDSEIFLSFYPSYMQLNLCIFNFVLGSALCALYVLIFVFVTSLLAIYYFLYFSDEEIETQSSRDMSKESWAVSGRTSISTHICLTPWHVLSSSVPICDQILLLPPAYYFLVHSFLHFSMVIALAETFINAHLDYCKKSAKGVLYPQITLPLECSL